jgi:polysaccharide export outer membrane protein
MARKSLLACVTGWVVLLLAGAAVPPAAGQNVDYVLGPQDVVTVTVFDHLNLSGKFSIEADGTLTFPLIGRLRAAGLTPRALDEVLRQRLSEGYLRDPQLSVTVEQYRSQKVFIMGAVTNPGPLMLSGNTTLIEALSSAGSTTNEAMGEAVVVRARPGRAVLGPTLPEQVSDAEVVRVDLRALEGGEMSQNLVLHDGDTVVVSRGEQVYLLGQVRSPGAYAIRRGMTLLQAVALAGGATERGAIGRAKVIRIVAGKKREFKLKAEDLVLAGDTIVIPEKYF